MCRSLIVIAEKYKANLQIVTKLFIPNLLLNEEPLHSKNVNYFHYFILN